MEWAGNTISKMSTDERMTLTNMAIEAGAKSGIIAPDIETLNYLFKREVDFPYHLIKQLISDEDANYAKIKRMDTLDLEPLVAKPYLPSNVSPASELNNIKIDQAYIGGCTGGKWEDFVAAAEVLEGKRVAKDVRLLIVPSTTDIQKRMIEGGLASIFIDADGVFCVPTCGACLGGHMGVLAPGEKCISTTNRNFVGRMGDKTSEVYLASPKTVAASAIAGYITGAEK
jgi:3-isopropylmalate/(R)-2-methylmalate dehydratase large subunit